MIIVSSYLSNICSQSIIPYYCGSTPTAPFTHFNPCIYELLLFGKALFILTLCYSPLLFCLINLLSFSHTFFCLSCTFIILHHLISLCSLLVPWAVHCSLSLFLLAPITTINPEMRYSILISSCFLAICHPLKVQTVL